MPIFVLGVKAPAITEVHRVRCGWPFISPGSCTIETAFMYMYMYGWVPLLSAWNHHDLVKELFSNTASLVAQMVKNPPVVQDTWVWSLGQKDPLEKEMTTHSSILAWSIPCTEEPGALQSMASQSRTRLSDYHSLQYKKKVGGKRKRKKETAFMALGSLETSGTWASESWSSCWVSAARGVTERWVVWNVSCEHFTGGWSSPV